MDRHLNVLSTVCRVGGRKFSSLKRSTLYPVGELREELREFFEIDVTLDQEGVHPPFICGVCHRALSRCKDSQAAGREFKRRGGGCGDRQEWAAHSDDCQLCDESRYRGKPKKKRRLRQEFVLEGESGPTTTNSLSLSGALNSSAIDINPEMTEGECMSSCGKHEKLFEPEDTANGDAHRSIEHLFGIATPNFKSCEDCILSPDRFLFPFDDLLCSVCHHVVNQSVEAPCCQQIFCTECIWLSTSEHCPTCRKELVVSNLVHVHPRIAGVLAQMPVYCDYFSCDKLGCPQKVALANLQSHVAQCPFRPGATPYTLLRRVINPSSTAAEILEAPHLDLQGDIALRLTHKLISAQETNGVLEVRTGSRGKAQTWVNLTKGQTRSGTAAPRTVRRRSNEMTAVRQLVSGGSEGAASLQSSELRCFSRLEWDRCLTDAGFTAQGNHDGVGLALKADLRLPWFKLRKLRCWLKSFGVNIESEASMRHQIREDLPFELNAELAPLADRGGTISLKPVVRFPDLVGLVLHYLRQHELANTLTWHNGALPADKVWVKLGGDHGGGSFKLSFQIANTAHPNAAQHTIPFLVFAAPDTVENLTTTFKPYAEQVEQLMAATWHGRRIRCVLFGDYEFMCVNFGMSGPSGKHPCLYCSLTKEEMQDPPAKQPSGKDRTLDNLKEDLQQFQAKGSCLTKAKLFNNVIRPCLLPVALQWVCIPALHLDLGIYMWMFESFIADMRDLDAQLASHLGRAGMCLSDSATFADAAKLSSLVYEKGQLQHEMQVQVNNIHAQVGMLVFLSKRN